MASISLTAAHVEKALGTVLVKMSGALDATTAPDYEQFMQQTISDGYSNFLVDLAGCRQINEAGLDSLVQTDESLKNIGGKIALFNIQPKVMVVFKMLQLDTFFHIFHTQADALKFLSGQG